VFACPDIPEESPVTLYKPLRFIDSPPFTIARWFYEEARRHSAENTEDRASLARIAWSNQQTLLQALPTVPAEREGRTRTALSQGCIIAALWDIHCRPVFHVPQALPKALTLLYGSMLYRLAQNVARDTTFDTFNPIPQLKSHYSRLIPVLTDELPSLHQFPANTMITADYLNYLAFTAWLGPRG
jgi:hypothetical protein